MNSSQQKRVNMYLNRSYTSQACKIPLRPWDKSQYMQLSNVYTNVYTDTNGKTFNQLESFYDIFQKSNTINGHKRILCVGRPGCGKSTLMAKLALDWSSGETRLASMGISNVFLIQMPGLKKETSVEEAISRQILGGRHFVSPNGLENYIDENQSQCALLFDGYDECSYKICDATVDNNIVRILRNEKYPDCLVFVTTRPCAASDFHYKDLQMTYHVVEIKGFLDAQPREYMDRFFKGRTGEHANDLQVYLESHTVVKELSYVPLFFAIICDMWEVNKLEVGNTLSRLFSFLNSCLWYHHQSKHGNIFQPRDQLEIFCISFGKVALKKLLADSQTDEFTKSDLNDTDSKCIDFGCKVGLISRETTIENTIPETTEPFVTHVGTYHRLALHYFASKYLTEIDLRLCQCLDESMSSKKKVVEFEKLLRFVSGVNPSACLVVLRHVLKQAIHYEQSWLHLLMLNIVSESSSINRDISGCFEECFNNGLCLKSIDTYTVSGLEKLDASVRDKITTVRMRSKYIHVDDTNRLLSCLQNLRHLTIEWSRWVKDLKPVLSIRRLQVDHLTEAKSYQHALALAPKAHEITVGCGHRKRNSILKYVSSAMESGENKEWKEVTIDGSTARGAVSRDEGKRFADIIAKHVRNLEELELCRLDMDESSLVDIVKSCLQIPTIREIVIALCNSHIGGELDTFVNDLPGISNVKVYHSKDYRSMNK